MRVFSGVLAKTFVDCAQVELSKAHRVRENVDLDDAPTPDGEAHDRKELSTRKPHYNSRQFGIISPRSGRPLRNAITNWLRSLLGLVGVLFSFNRLDTYYQTKRMESAVTSRASV
jgi:hypothetical protein